MEFMLTGMMMLGNIYRRSEILEFWHEILLNLALNIILFYLLFLYNFTINKQEWIPWRRYFWSIIGSFLITIIFTRISWGLRELIYDRELNRIHMLKEYAMTISVLLISAMLYSFTRRQQIALENEKLHAENIQMQYDALKSKVDPHFLFNSLNILSGMVEDNKKAQIYIEQLSDIYRYIISDKKVVTLVEELKFTQSYIFLMQIRHNNNLHITWNIDPQYYSTVVPPISLQLLIENAIKHNVVSDKYPLNIHIYTTNQKSIIVKNHIHPIMDKPKGTGIGLSNLNQRYTVLINQTISISHDEENYMVEMPLIQFNQITTLIKQLQ